MQAVLTKPVSPLRLCVKIIRHFLKEFSKFVGFICLDGVDDIQPEYARLQLLHIWREYNFIGLFTFWELKYLIRNSSSV